MSDTTTSNDPEPTPAPPPPPARTGGGVLPVLLGGVIAGGIGYLAAYYTEFGLFAQPDPEDRLGQIAATLETQAARLDQIEAVETAAVDSSATDQLEGQIGDIAGTLDALASRIEGLEAGGDAPAATLDEGAFTNLEEQVAGLSETSGQIESLSGGLDEIGAQLDTLTETQTAQATRLVELAARLDDQAATMDELRDGISEAGNSAEAQAARIAAQGAVSGIRAAIESGESFADELGALNSASDVAVPAPLADVAPDGVPTLAALQDSFPDAARDALSASIAASIVSSS